MSLLFTHSDDREGAASVTASQSTFNLHNFPNQWKDPKGLQMWIDKLVIPGTFYPITTANNSIRFEANGVEHTVTITPRTYTMTELATELATVLTGGTLTSMAVSWLAQEQAFQYTPTLSSGSFRFMLESPLFTAHRAVGYAPEDLNTALVATTVSFNSNAPALYPICFKVFASFTGRATGFDGQANAFGSLIATIALPNDYARGGMIVYEQDPAGAFTIPEIRESLRLTIRDDRNRLMDFRGAPVFMSLRFYKVSSDFPKAVPASAAYLQAYSDHGAGFATHAAVKRNLPFEVQSATDRRVRPRIHGNPDPRTLYEDRAPTRGRAHGNNMANHPMD